MLFCVSPFVFNRNAGWRPYEPTGTALFEFWNPMFIQLVDLVTNHSQVAFCNKIDTSFFQNFTIDSCKYITDIYIYIF